MTLSPGFDAHVHTFPPTADDVWEVERALQPSLVLLAPARRRAIATELRDNPDVASPFTLGIGPAGVAWTSAIGGSELPWSRVGAIERRRHDLLLRLARPSGVARLPRRVASPEEIERFAAAAERWIREAAGPLDAPEPPGFDVHRLRFRAEEGDIDAFLSLMAGDNPQAFGRAMPAWIVLSMGVLAVVLALRAVLTEGLTAWAGVAFVTGLLLAALGLVPPAIPVLNRRLVRRAWRKEDQAEVELAFGPAGILQLDAGGRHVTPWPAVRRLVETPEHLFLFMARGGALIVPSRAFGDRQALDALRADVRGWQSAAAPPLPPRPEVPLAAPREPGDPFEPPAT